MIIDHLLGRKTIVDIRTTETEQEFDNRPVRTSNVHFALETGKTTDIVLDEFTCSAYTPEVWDRVRVSGGRVQWFAWIFEMEAQDSPPLRPYEAKECDPGIIDESGTNSCRWAMLCVFKNVLTDEPYLDWEYGEVGGPYPFIPHNGVPLALIKYDPGPRPQITEDDIINLRTVKAEYAPAGYYIFPPVREHEDLYERYTRDVPDGAVSFVINEAQWYFHENGEWGAQGRIRFENTSYSKDIMQETSRVDIPWILKSSAELAVYRDGLKMDPRNDYEVHLGAAPYVLFNYLLYPHQRILMFRNPFAADAYSADAINNMANRLEIWVDGEVGHDAFPGSEDMPFKTLQMAFNSIPLSSRFTVIVRARRLKYADVIISNEYGQRSWGILNNRLMHRFMIFIEPNCEWQPDIDYAFVITQSSFIYFDRIMPPYKFRLNSCISYFFRSEFESHAVLAGGHSVVRDADAKRQSALQISGACIAIIESSYIYHLIGTAAGYSTAVGSRFSAIQSASSAAMYFDNCDFLESVNVTNAYFHIIQSRIARECTGIFDAANVQAVNLLMIGEANAPSRTFFDMQNGSKLTLVAAEIRDVAPNAIRLTANSVAALRGVVIRGARGDGILLDGSSYVFIQDSDISNCAGNGISMIRSCSGFAERLYGSANMHYGILARKYSSMNRGSNVEISGANGTYLEVIEGGNTVAATWGDLHVAPLDVKIEVGGGLRKEVRPTGIPDDARLWLFIDPADLLNPNSDFGAAFNFAPKASVATFTQPMAPNDVYDQDVIFVGEGYLSSVSQRSTLLTNENRTILTIDATEQAFLQQNRTLGTHFTPTGVTLRHRPGLGYATNFPYYFTSLWTSFSSIQSFIMNSLTGLTIQATTPPGTEVRVGISPNAGGTWLHYSGGAWAALPGQSTAARLASAPLFSVVNGYPPAAWEELRLLAHSYICVGFSLLTTSFLVAPTVHQYTWDFQLAGFQKDVTHLFERVYYPGRTVFRNISGQVLEPPLVFSVFPLSNRDA